MADAEPTYNMDTDIYVKTLNLWHWLWGWEMEDPNIFLYNG